MKPSGKEKAYSKMGQDKEEAHFVIIEISFIIFYGL